MLSRAALLDRDGTIIEDKHYLSDPKGVRLLPGVGQGLRDLIDLGLILVIVTNQSGIGRGLFSEEQAQKVHSEMVRQLACERVQISGIYHCPHSPADRCGCRKPALGLVEEASSGLHFKPENSFMFGDRACDIELGRQIRAKTFLIRGHDAYSPESQEELNPDYTVEGIAQAVPIITHLIEEEKGVGN